MLINSYVQGKAELYILSYGVVSVALIIYPANGVSSYNLNKNILI